MAVLILASEDDGEAIHVARALTERGADVWWFDTAWFPSRARVTAWMAADGWRGVISTPHAMIDLAEVSSVYYQQSQPFSFPTGLSEPERRFATIETRFGLGGLLSSLPARWVSHPSKVADAEYRITQMAVAAAAGLTVPASILTNQAGPAQEFAAAQDGGAVYKSIMHKVVSEENQVKLIYTTAVDPAAIDERIAVAPHLFQRNIAKRFDARIVVTSRGVCLGVAIHTTDPGARQDWRTRYDNLTYEVVGVPAEVAQGCIACLAALRIEVGVFDFSVDRGGAWWFLEVGPGAAWAWLAEATGLPVADAIADTILEGGAR